jgi:hypothetical protein
MTREQKIAAIWEICIKANPDDFHIRSRIRLRNVIAAIRAEAKDCRVDERGYFVITPSSSAAGAQWNGQKNSLSMQDDSCIDFLYELLCSPRPRITS